MNYETFEAEVLKLPETLEGLSNLISGMFWDLVAQGMANPKKVTNPAIWADRNLSNWIATFFLLHGEEFDEQDFYPASQQLRTTLVGQATSELMALNAADTDSSVSRRLLDEIEKAGVNSEILQGVIKRGFPKFLSEVKQARIAVLIRKSETDKTVRGKFLELASLAQPEMKLLLKAPQHGDRKNALSRKIAAELVGGRADLDVTTVQKYAQPGENRGRRKDKGL